MLSNAAKLGVFESSKRANFEDLIKSKFFFNKLYKKSKDKQTLLDMAHYWSVSILESSDAITAGMQKEFMKYVYGLKRKNSKKE